MMSIETRDQVLERIMLLKPPKCPHCGQEMTLWEVPPFNFADGAGWGTPFLFLCFNDECPSYRNGWNHIGENYAHKASYRCMNYPGTDQFEYMLFFSDMGGRGQVLDEQLMVQQEAVKEAIKRGFSVLAECYVSKDGPQVLKILTDAAEPARVRLKAAEMIGDIGELEAIEPIRNLKFGNKLIQEKVNAAIGKIHERHFTRECPFCAEIIKRRAKICKHCGKDVTEE
jgi:hypothetical protein